MLSAYPACFFKESNGYSVIFPDLNWLATCGESLEEAFTQAVDCLAGYLYMNKKEGLEPSKPSSVNDIDYLFLEVPKISAIKASWRTFEKFKPRSKPALLSQAGIVRVF